MKIVDVEGIGPAYAEKLQAVGVRTTTRLLKEGATAKGRKELAAKSGVSGKLILEWINRADLMRVKGIGAQFSDLLERAGVDSVKELRNRRADKLHAALLKANEPRHYVKRPPTFAEVEKWIKAAKKLPPVVTY